MALYQSGSGLGALVGVGTTNPTSNLQVYGTPIAAGNVFSVLNTAASGNVAQFSSSAGTALIINANGNVGIGKTNPGTLLDVNGALTATTISGTTLTASTSHNTSGSGVYQVAGTTVVDSSRNLTNIGTVSATTITGSTDASFNSVTVGIGSGSVATNTAIGKYALLNNTTGSLNTAVGESAMYTNSTGLQNTALGARALYYNTGSTNTAVGDQAMYNNIDGVSGTAVGNQTLYTNTSGQYNTAVGQRALFLTSTGGFNTALGERTMYNNSTGTNNTAVGQNALSTNTTGSNNTALGKDAGPASTALTNTTCIGYNASASISNSVILGNGANVGIGTASPGYLLDVLGIVRAGSTVGTSIYLTNSEVKWRGDGTAHYSIFNQNSTLQIRNTSGNSEPGTAGSNLVTITTTGNVGIGMTDPSNALDVSSSQASARMARFCNFKNDGGSQDVCFIHTDQSFNNAVWSGSALTVTTYPSNGTNNAGYIAKFGTSDSAGGSMDPKVVISAAYNKLGFVGIGTASPRCTLDVVGSGITEGIYAKRFYLAGPGDNTDSSGSLNDGGPWYGLGYSVDSGLTSYIQLASFYGLSFKTGGSYILMNGGNVGIGTTSPSYTFHTYGGGIGVTGTSNYMLQGVTNSTTSGIWILFDSQTAGGTSGRKYQIGSSLSGNASGAGNFEFYDATAGAWRWLIDANGNFNRNGASVGNPGINMGTGGAGITWGNNYSRIYDDGDLKIYTDDNMHFLNAGTETITILNNGFVGINQTSPGYRLDVNGDIRTTASLYYGAIRSYRTSLSYTSSAFYPLIDLPGGAYASRVTIHWNATPYAASIAFYFIDGAGTNTGVSEYNVTYFRAGQYSTGAGNAYIAQYNEAGTGGICEFLISKVTGRAHFNITSAFCWPGVGATRSQGQGYTTGSPNRIVLYSIPGYNVQWWSVTENYYV